jgi:Spy/CpxP family protein refolding chaperone
MRKALVPLLASLALCGAATAALIATNARADQSGHKPVMIALVTPNNLPPRMTEAPPPEGGQPSMPGDAMRDMGVRRGQMCHDMYAGKVGELAFLEAKLSLDAKQAPLFDRWKQTTLDIAKQHEGECTGKRPRRAAGLRGQRPSVVDRLTQEEDMLKKRVAYIEAERPALAALYNALTPQQKEEFGRGGMGRMGGMHMMLGMMDRHPGMGMMRHGPMGGPPPGPMGAPPEPPPAQ